VGPDETRPQAELEHASCASIKKGASARCLTLLGLWPLVGGDNESKASCGVIRSGSGEPGFDCKERYMKSIAQLWWSRKSSFLLY
jgi:hypothetical protein